MCYDYHAAQDKRQNAQSAFWIFIILLQNTVHYISTRRTVLHEIEIIIFNEPACILMRYNPNYRQNVLM